MLKKQIVVIKDTSQMSVGFSKYFGDVINPNEIKSIASVPLVINDRAVGAITKYFIKSHVFDQEELFYQSTPEEVASKRKLFPKRMDSYFSCADSIYLFWNDESSYKERLAATLIQGTFTILNSEALSLFTLQFEKERKALALQGEEIPCWENLLALYKKRF